LGQKLVYHSAIWSLNGFDRVTLDQKTANQLERPAGITQPPVYFIALCSAAQAHLPEVEGQLWLFDDREESVYQHYIGEIRRNMAAGGIIAGLEKELEELKNQLEQARRIQQAGRDTLSKNK